MVITIATNLSRRISAVETVQETAEEETVRVSADSAAPPSTATQRLTRSARSKRCHKCHARGHDATECRTANPSAMRRRVASNTRIAKEARANVAIPFSSGQAPTPLIWQSPFQPNLMSTAQYPYNYVNLAADASELRRRTAQSARDRRLHRRRTSSTTSR
jgi:hypothetical protein